jgi:uncharacterized protein (TIGR02466 family)
MIQNLFSLPIYKTNLFESDIDFDSIRKCVENEFNSVNVNVSLEKNGGVSTYATNRQLHTNPEFKKLNELILYHVNLYWKVLDINDGLHPEIDECWSNLHRKGSFTDLHSHSMHPVVVSFYLSAPPDSGSIIFVNPMEYAITHMPYNYPVEDKINTTVYVRSGDVCLFPGWLRHKTEESNTNEDRIVITFNIRYSGLYLDSQVPYPNIVEKPMPKTFNEQVTIESNNSAMDYLFNKLHTQEMLIRHLTNLLTGDENGK